MWKPLIALALALAALTGLGTTPAAGFHDNPFGGCAQAVREAVERPQREAEAHRREAEERRRTTELRSRAEAGELDAQYELGLSLSPRPEALLWLCRAADRGHAEARFRLAVWHELPAGKYYAQSHLWYGLAAAAGHARATSERAKLAAKMTPKELANSRRLAKAWHPGQCDAAFDRYRTGG